MFVVHFNLPICIPKQMTIFANFRLADLVAKISGVQCFGLRGSTPLQRTGQAFEFGDPWSFLDGKLFGTSDLGRRSPLAMSFVVEMLVIQKNERSESWS